MNRDIQNRLLEPFHPDDIGWKPQAVKGNRAMALAYIDARNVQERLDDVVGIQNWQDSYEVLADGSVVCRLSIRIDNEWIEKTDVGSQSEQPDGGDRMKSAFSDALKRAAVKWGIGRYLYNLPNVWVDYDPTKKSFVNKPNLPAWALPKRKEVQQQPQQKSDNEPIPISVEAANLLVRCRSCNTHEEYKSILARAAELKETLTDYDKNMIRELLKSLQVKFGAAK